MDTTTRLVRTEWSDAIAFRLRMERLDAGEESTAVRAEVTRLVEEATTPVIIDLAEIEYMGSSALGWLIRLRALARERDAAGFRPPCRRHGGLFAIYADVESALDAIRSAETDPFVLCGVRPEVAEILVVCQTRRT